MLAVGVILGSLLVRRFPGSNNMMPARNMIALRYFFYPIYMKNSNIFVVFKYSRELISRLECLALTDALNGPNVVDNDH
jgi:hypothetical protein